MKIISWNVNGIRAAIKKGFADFALKENPDILCVQETKAQPEQVTLELPGYEQYWNSAEKKGYSGTAVFTKISPVSHVNGIGVKAHDLEGRVLTLEFPDFYLVTVYTPNSQRGLTRLEYRSKLWDPAFLRYVKKLENSKGVIFCGDLNVAHKEIDLSNPKSNAKTHGFTPEERRGFDNIIKKGFIDSFREFNAEGGNYTWWSQMNNCRARNIGWRIDYFCLSSGLRPRLEGAGILSEVTGSDHCPIYIDFKDAA